MHVASEGHRVGIRSMETATTLLQEIRGLHPTAGLFEAADLQWWWRTPRATDDAPQLFWFDDQGRPRAAVIMTDWGDRVALDPMMMPDAEPDWVAHVVGRGLAHATASGFGPVDREVEIAVDVADRVMVDVLTDNGFGFKADETIETWMAAEARPAISELSDGYRLSNRSELQTVPHHMIARNGPDIDARLRQTSLYRPELDLVVLDENDQAAGYGLFWFDPETATGLVEPMRTLDQHQRRGLARHILTAGINRLAESGAKRIKIVFEPDNAAAGGLYLGVGFETVRRNAIFGPDRSLTER